MLVLQKGQAGGVSTISTGVIASSSSQSRYRLSLILQPYEPTLDITRHIVEGECQRTRMI